MLAAPSCSGIPPTQLSFGGAQEEGVGLAETLEWRKLGKPGILSHTPVEDTAMATPQGPARLPGNSSRPSEEGDPLSPSRWTEIQRDDESQGPPVCEDMAPLPVVGGMDMEEPLWKAVCWYLSAPWVCALCPGPPPAWIFSQ